ncbi:MAG: DNA replication/repair protein RecF [Peptoniphilus sp.]|nr:DNA replication/repair protein RecF [Peptoniphilus sp.]MDD7363534.1 DNA replication/repair protein RecF [Bacillota bacterium]MDY6044763.1 DNA replication/repair protein RecF [Peptoniphilus sp.]
MFIEKLDMVSFRNHDHLSMDFDEKIYRLIGPNGTGKTNFLEAIYVVMTGRSFRTHALKEVISFGSESAFLSARVVLDSFEHDLAMTIKENAKRYVRDNNPRKRAKDYASGLGVVVFEPKHLQMVQGSPSLRRELIDDMLRMTSPVYDDAYRGYMHVLYQRNYVLRKLKEPSLLDVYDMRLSKYAAVLLRERLKFLKRMASSVSDYYKTISGDRETLDVRYKASFPVTLSENLEGEFYESLKRTRERDRERGRTGIGPHLDDISFLLDGVEAKKFSSTGQIRSIVLALKCLEIDHLRDYIGSHPVVLLDDVLSELDASRRDVLLSVIKGQCFITSAEAIPSLEETSQAVDLR